MFDVCPCTICGEAGHTVGRCNELWQNKVPPPERGQGGDDEEDSLQIVTLTVPRTIIFNYINHSNLNHSNPRNLRPILLVANIPQPDKICA